MNLKSKQRVRRVKMVTTVNTISKMNTYDGLQEKNRDVDLVA